MKIYIMKMCITKIYTIKMYIKQNYIMKIYILKINIMRIYMTLHSLNYIKLSEMMFIKMVMAETHTLSFPNNENYLNGVLRAAARMIGGVPKFGHISDYMRDVFHWLPVQQRIHYRISYIVWHCVLGNAPSYLPELFILTSACSGRRPLRSATKGDFHGATCSHCHQTENSFLDCGSLCLE